MFTKEKIQIIFISFSAYEMMPSVVRGSSILEHMYEIEYYI